MDRCARTGKPLVDVEHRVTLADDGVVWKLHVVDTGAWTWLELDFDRKPRVLVETRHGCLDDAAFHALRGRLVHATWQFTRRAACTARQPVDGRTYIVRGKQVWRHAECDGKATPARLTGRRSQRAAADAVVREARGAGFAAGPHVAAVDKQGRAHRGLDDSADGHDRSHACVSTRNDVEQIEGVEAQRVLHRSSSGSRGFEDAPLTRRSSMRKNVIRLALELSDLVVGFCPYVTSSKSVEHPAAEVPNRGVSPDQLSVTFDAKKAVLASVVGRREVDRASLGI